MDAKNARRHTTRNGKERDINRNAKENNIDVQNAILRLADKMAWTDM